MSVLTRKRRGLLALGALCVGVLIGYVLPCAAEDEKEGKTEVRVVAKGAVIEVQAAGDGGFIRVEVQVNGQIIGLPGGARVVVQPADADPARKAQEKRGEKGQKNAGAPEEDDGAEDVPGMTHAVFFDADREIGARLRKAAELQDAGKVQQAFDLYQYVLENASEGLFRLADDRFLGVRDYCIERITKLPPELLIQYRLHVDGEVARLFEEACGGGDPAEVEALAVRYFLSSHGPEMLDFAGDMYAGRGEYARAASCWRRLSRWGGQGRIPAELIETKRALTLAKAGRVSDAREILEELRRKNPDVQLLLGGEARRLVPYLDAELPNKPGTVIGSAEVDRTHWPQFGGEPGHGATMPARFKCDVKVGEFTIPGYEGKDIASRTLSGARFAVLSNKAKLLDEIAYAPFHPVYGGGRIFVHDDSGILGFRVNGIGEEWVVGEMRSARRIGRNPRSAVTYGTQMEQKAYACAYDRGMVYASLSAAPNGKEVWAVSEKGEMIWRLSMERVGFEWLAEMSEISDPVVFDGKLYFCVWKADQWRRDCHLVSVDASEGDLIWRRFVCSGPKMPYYRFGRYWHVLPTLCMPAAADGVVVVCSDGGGIAGVDARSGDILWGFAYEQTVPHGQQIIGPGRQPSPAIRSSSSTPIIHRGRVYVAPVDSNRVYALDLAGGECLWRARRGQHDRLVGLAGDRLILSGKTVAALDTASGRTTWEYGGEEMAYSGQGFITADALYVPGKGAIYRFDPSTGRLLGRLLVSRDQEEFGNLLLVEDSMVQLGKRAGFFGRWDTVYAQIERDIRRNVKDPYPHMKLGGIYARKEDRTEAIRSYEKALALLSGLSGDVDVRMRGKARERLFELYAEEADEALKKGRTDDALRFALRGRTRATDSEDSIQAVVRLVEVYEKRKDWTNVVLELQSFLDRPSRVVYSFDGDSAMVPSLYARLRIDVLIAGHGRGIYAPVEAKARRLYERGLKSDLETLVDRYPNSLSSRRALLRLADMEASAGRFRKASRLLSEYVRLGRDDADDLVQVKWKLAHYYEREKQYAEARRILTDLAKTYPQAMVGTGDDRRPLAQVVAARLADDAYRQAGLDMPLSSFRVPLTPHLKLPVGASALRLRHGSHMLLADQTGIIRGVDGGTGKVMWNANVTGNQVYTSDVEDGRLLLSGFQTVRMLDVETGKVLWTHTVGNVVGQALKGRRFLRLITGATLGEDHVAISVGHTQRELVVLDANRGGKVLWKKKLPTSPVWGPIISHDRVVATTVTDVLVFDLATGEKVLEIPNQRAMRPAIVLDDGRLLVPGHQGLVCVDLKTGRTLWSRAHRAYWRAYYGYSGAFDGVVRRDEGSYFLSNTADRKVVCVDVASGKEMWSVTLGDAREIPRGIRVDGDSVYVLTMRSDAFERSARVFHLDLKTGRRVWSSPIMKDAFPKAWEVGTDHVAILADRWEFVQVGKVRQQRVLDATVFCIDRTSGKITQQLPVKTDEDAPRRDRPYAMLAVDEVLWLVFQNRMLGLRGPR